VLDQTRRFFEGSLAEGFTGGRATGELVCQRGGGLPPSESLLAYEAKLTQVLALYPSTVVCQYDVRQFDGATMMDILSVHPYTIVRGQLVVNPYYIEPDQFLAGRAARGFPSGS
jgi:hypothetical protein